MTKIVILMAASMFLALSACGVVPGADPGRSERNANLPGWTGTTFVVGSTSTVAGDATATYNQQKWQNGGMH
jgi:hypothetical protein